MAKVRTVLTAGYNRALHVVTLAELLRREGHIVTGVLIVRAFQIQRAVSLLRQRGMGVLRANIYKLAGRSADGKRDSSFQDLWEEFNVSDRSLSAWCKKHGVNCRCVSSLNDVNAVRFVRQTNAHGVIYGGGGILKKDFLEAAEGRVLNAHSGPLPEIRGMNACEWSLLLNYTPTVTIHLIDRGIDTGPALDALPIRVEPNDTIERLREKCTVAGVKGLLRNVEFLTDVHHRLSLHDNKGKLHRQCYVLAPALRELLEERLRRILREHRACG